MIVILGIFVILGTEGRHNMIEGGSAGHRMHGGSNVKKLSTKETFNLYKTFMGVAEAEEGKGTGEAMHIEKRVEDERQLPEQAEFEFNMSGQDIMGNGYVDHDDYGDGFDFDTEELDHKLERRMRSGHESGMRLEQMPGGRGYLMKNPEPDTISYISQASEHSDLLY